MKLELSVRKEPRFFFFLFCIFLLIIIFIFSQRRRFADLSEQRKFCSEIRSSVFCSGDTKEQKGKMCCFSFVCLFSEYSVLWAFLFFRTLFLSWTTKRRFLTTAKFFEKRILRSDAEANLSTIAKMRDEIKSNSIIRPAATIPQPASFFFQDGLVCWRHCCGSDCDILF